MIAFDIDGTGGAFMTSLRQLKRFEARISLFKSLDCPLALAAAGTNQRFTRYPPVINHNLGWCNWNTTVFYNKNDFENLGFQMAFYLSALAWRCAKSSLQKVFKMVWHVYKCVGQATSYYLNQWWLNYRRICVSRPESAGVTHTIGPIFHSNAIYVIPASHIYVIRGYPAKRALPAMLTHGR